MKRRDIADELSAPGAVELLTTGTVARLAYTALDDTPRVVPLGFFWTGAQVVMATAVSAPKVAALVARPAVALTIDIGDSPASARSLLIRGRAGVDIVGGVVPEYLSGAAKVMDDVALAQFEEACRALYDRMVRIAITPRWARYFDFGSGVLPRFLVELAEQKTA